MLRILNEWYIFVNEYISMKKLIFRKLYSDILLTFLVFCFVIGIIVWILQAVNYLDFVTQDGHGLKTYFLFSIYNFPKIINRILPFIFFLAIFYTLITYEQKNELVIFWSNGISKIKFSRMIINFALFLTIFQILLSSIFSPMFQNKARLSLKNSNIDYFSALIKNGKFVNIVNGLTIFIKSKNVNGNYENIFIDDSSKVNNRTIYAKNGLIIQTNNSKIFKLYNGKVINKDKEQINIFEFEQIDFNLSNFKSNTILVPKIQETSTINLLKCLNNNFLKKIINILVPKNNKCENNLKKKILYEELLKRLYKPLYIPIISIICCYLIILPKSNYNYKVYVKIIFLIVILLLIISESALRYSTNSYYSLLIYFTLPWLFSTIAYFKLKKNLNNA